jgi:peptidoglycan/LPS O-acetylase OafA/YrhL
MGALRFYLAMVVAMAHLQLTILASKGLSLWGGFYLGFNAGFAVMVFFMISGFLISMVLASKYEETPGGPSQFYFNRFVRIFSLYLPLAAVSFIAVDGTWRDFSNANIVQKITSIGLLGADWVIFAYGSSPDGWLALLNPMHQAWTLSPELTFYIVAPWLLRSNRTTLVLLLVSFVIRFALVATMGFSERWTYIFLPSTFLFFLLGHWARLVAARHALLQRPAVVCGLLIVCFSVLIIRPEAQWDSLKFWLAMICLAASLPGLFQLTKDNQLLNWFGALSYPIYLTHNLVRMEFERFNLFNFLPPFLTTGFILTACYLPAVLLAAITAHYLVEQPCANGMRAIRRFFISRYRQPAGSVSV